LFIEALDEKGNFAKTPSTQVKGTMSLLSNWIWLLFYCLRNQALRERELHIFLMLIMKNTKCSFFEEIKKNRELKHEKIKTKSQNI